MKIGSSGIQNVQEGIILDIFDAKNQKTRVIADYAIIYSETDLVDLQGNVVVASFAQDSLFAEQLYFDQNKQWLFTNLPVTYKSKDYLTKGSGFDSDRDFKKAEVLEVSGLFAVEEE
ncbi:LPS export ABC transporter periplasmic protein LptC [Lacinutrix neustonica]|uniref:LPS export ABC transporter periplasmic protein LptC n=1 Tax=Lacinutrix neustonica TaxID=2980107 RepID=A0A9E8MW89_9FLAO|nr:LPS export ABC transporter periplasmic protein LptC [Lacinutrix neustonica]WAC01424.1 LPS export ABC transporter periplasmic protein LptC [Lacinutrix neustonica]